MYHKADLITLVREGDCCQSILRGVPPDVQVDYEAGVWQLRQRAPDAMFLIGSADPEAVSCGSRVIGVYDRSKIDHIHQMNRDGRR